VVLRTSWVYAARGKNFVRTMLALAEQHDRVRVVADQVGCPTNADDLAVAILAIANRLLAGWQASFAGVFHAAGSGATSWHGLAEAVFAAAAAQGRNVPEVVAISTAEYPTPARRPADSRLDCTKLFDVLDIRMPDWRPGVARTVSQIVGRAAVPAAAVA
jgi:dTDP-4-dehydrorhamnose reductase